MTKQSRYDIQYDRIYRNKGRVCGFNAYNQTEQKGYEFDDPILEMDRKRKRQTIKFVKEFLQEILKELRQVVVVLRQLRRSVS